MGENDAITVTGLTETHIALSKWFKYSVFSYRVTILSLIGMK